MTQLVFGLQEAQKILKNQRDKERHDKGELNTDELVKMSAELYAALKIRNDCPECDGRGGRWVHVYEDDVDFDVCECVEDATTIIKRYGRFFEIVAAKYLNVSYPEITEMDDGFVLLETEVLEKAKRPQQN